MQIKTIHYKRVKSLGNYQSETLEATADLDEGDDPVEASNALRDFVCGQLYPSEPKKTDETIPEVLGDGDETDVPF